MEVILKIADSVAHLPDAVSYLLCPAFLLFCAFILALAGGKKFYASAVALFGAGELFFAGCEGNVRAAAVCMSLYVIEAAILFPLFYIRFPKRHKKLKADKMYEKFYLDLDHSANSASQKEYPPKVCCFDEEEVRSLEDGSLRLKHATELLEKLLSAKLAASDRLEADMLSRRLDGYRNRALSESELRALNDCLASILKFTAKYQL